MNLAFAAALTGMTSTPPQQTGLSRIGAAAVVIGALTLSGAISRRYSPDPSHPRLRRWYKALEKPAATPPDAVFAAGWPVLLTALGYGTYRLMRQQPSLASVSASALAGLTVAMVTGYSKLAFGDRDLTDGTSESQALMAVAAGYVVVAGKADRPAALLGVPLLLWSAFGCWLTAELRDRNVELDSGAN